MTNARRWIISLGVAALVATGGGGSFARDQAATQPVETPAAADPVQFEKLAELLPAELGGLRRDGEPSGQSVAMGEMKMSNASAMYGGENEGAPSIQIDIADYAAMPDMLQAMTPWTQMQLNSRDSNGYQKTVQVQGHPGYETYDNSEKSGNVVVMVAGRFVVSMTTDQLPPEKLAELAANLPVKQLEELTR